MLRLAKNSIRSAKHRVRVPADVAIRRKQDEVERARMTEHVRYRASEETRERNMGVPIKPIEMWELFDSRSRPRDAEEVRAGREGEKPHGAGWGSWSRGKLFFRTRKSWVARDCKMVLSVWKTNQSNVSVTSWELLRAPGSFGAILGALMSIGMGGAETRPNLRFFY